MENTCLSFNLSFISIANKYFGFATLQTFIYKHIINLENVERNKKKEKGEFIRCQVNSN
jgi:hypothetical protein